MEFRRINNLPPYVFAQVNDLKIEARRAGEDVIDLGFGNPDIASPPVVVEKLVEAARNDATTAIRLRAACPTSARRLQIDTAADLVSNWTPIAR